jgi:hypothetical protein
MASFKELIGQLLSRDRRKATRQPSPQLSAYFWNGGAPTEHSIRNISSTGLFLVTEERWFPGTLIVITLQKKDEAEGSSERSISVQSKAVRWGEDGVGLEFVVSDQHDAIHVQNGMGSINRRTLEKFLQNFRAETGFVVIHAIFSPPESTPEPNLANS